MRAPAGGLHRGAAGGASTPNSKPAVHYHAAVIATLVTALAVGPLPGCVLAFSPTTSLPSVACACRRSWRAGGPSWALRG